MICPLVYSFGQVSTVKDKLFNDRMIFFDILFEGHLDQYAIADVKILLFAQRPFQ